VARRKQEGEECGKKPSVMKSVKGSGNTVGGASSGKKDCD